MQPGTGAQNEKTRNEESRPCPNTTMLLKLTNHTRSMRSLLRAHTIPKRLTPRWLLTLPIGRKSSASPATSSTKPSVGMEPTSKRSAQPFALTKVLKAHVSPDLRGCREFARALWIAAYSRCLVWPFLSPEGPVAIHRSDTSTGFAILPEAARAKARYNRLTSTGRPSRTSLSTAECIADRSSSRNSISSLLMKRYGMRRSRLAASCNRLRAGCYDAGKELQVHPPI